MKLGDAFKKYFILIRAYSIVDVLLLCLLAQAIVPVKEISVVHVFFSLIAGFFLWVFLTLSLEAKHKHRYRGSICWIVPGLAFFIGVIIASFFNIESLLFLFFVYLFAVFYIRKETNIFWGVTSSVWRGLYQTALFFTFLSFFIQINQFSYTMLGLGFVIFCFHLTRNLVADIRDVAFDSLTLVVFIGSRRSYIISLFVLIAGQTVLFLFIPNFFVIIPALLITTTLALYDDGFVLHKCLIMLTSFTFVNLMLYLNGSSLLYSNLLFLGVVSNLIFYEKVARPSNPIAQVSYRTRFLFKSQ